jgi:hypothetical protein
MRNGARAARRFPPPWSDDYSPTRISSAMLVRESRTGSCTFGLHERQDSGGMRLDTAASG